MTDKSQIIVRICQALQNNDMEQASQIALNEYPDTTKSYSKRTYSEYQSTKTFLRDGFIDRYSGQKLVFPATLRLLSNLLPQDFPFHKNWKMSDCHIVYWELFPTVDHVIPLARGGEDNEINAVSTSMLRNSAKSSWLLEELGWELQPAGKLEEWDGLFYWFLEYIGNHKDYLQDRYIQRWYRAATRA